MVTHTYVYKKLGEIASYNIINVLNIDKTIEFRQIMYCVIGCNISTTLWKQ
jgi:hypothetical protein